MTTAATVVETTINSQIEVFAEQFNAAAKKTVRSILVAAKIVLAARNALVLQAAKKSNYLLFLEKIAMNDSDADKLCVIAKQEERIEEFLSLAPTVDLKQSALYELAQLSDSDYETNIKSKFVVDVTAVNNVITFTAKTIASANTEKVAKKEAKAAKKKDAESNAVLPLVEDKQEEESTAEVPKADDKTVRQLDVDKVVSAANASILAVATSEASTYAKCDVTQVVVRIDDLSDEQKNKFMSRIKSVLDDFNLSTKAEFLSDFDANAAFADLEAA